MVAAIIGGAAALLCLCYCARKAVLETIVERREKISPQLALVPIERVAPIAAEGQASEQTHHARQSYFAAIDRIRKHKYTGGERPTVQFAEFSAVVVADTKNAESAEEHI